MSLDVSALRVLVTAKMVFWSMKSQLVLVNKGLAFTKRSYLPVISGVFDCPPLREFAYPRKDCHDHVNRSNDVGCTCDGSSCLIPHLGARHFENECMNVWLWRRGTTKEYWKVFGYWI